MRHVCRSVGDKFRNPNRIISGCRKWPRREWPDHFFFGAVGRVAHKNVRLVAVQLLSG